MEEKKESKPQQPLSGSAIKAWALDDRPREKMMAHGADALSKAELLAILIGSGIPGVSAVDLMRQVLADYGDSLRLLGKASIQDLTRYKGMGEAKAITVLAACQLANRRLLEEMKAKPRLNDSSDAYNYFRPRMQDLTVEECHLMLLNQSLHITGSVMLSHGGLAGASVDVREMLRHALLSQSPVVLLCHNHPSGNTTPSRDDDRLTEKANEACRAVGIRLIDHIIMGDNSFYSYLDNSRL